MQVKKIICLILCLVFFFVSCSNGKENKTTDTQKYSEETSVTFPSKLNHESTSAGNHGTVSGYVSDKYKIFFDYEWAVSKEFLRCYYNPENKEEPYHKENRYGIADKDGNIIIEPQFGSIFPVAKDRFCVANGRKDEYSEFTASEYAVINSKGEIIIPFTRRVDCMLEYFDGMENNYFCVSTENNEYYIADNNGNMVYDMYFSEYNKHHYPYLSFSGVCDGKLYSFDKNLNITRILDDKPVVDDYLTRYMGMQYSTTVCFKNGKCFYGVINEATGKEIVPCKYKEITVFAKDRIWASETATYEDPGGATAIYDMFGNAVCPEDECRCGEVFDWDDGMYLVAGIASSENPYADPIYGDCRMWLVDKNGNKISDIYYSVGYNKYGEMAGYFTADRGDRVFYLNKNGVIVGTIGK